MAQHSAHHQQSWGDYIAAIPEPIASILVICAIIGGYFLVRPTMRSLGWLGIIGMGLGGPLFFVGGVVMVYARYFPHTLPSPPHPNEIPPLPQGIGMAAGGLGCIKLSWDIYRATPPLSWKSFLP